MKIVYNPKDGAPITQFICNGEMIDPHYPDGFQMPNAKYSNGLVQYNDLVADQILETYMFLSEIDTDQAQAILSRPQDPAYKCEFPNCEFGTDTKVALIGHTKKHAKDIAAAGTPAIDPTLIPVAGGKKLQTIADKQKMRDNETEIPNGRDADGVDWYGEGAQVENKSASFGTMRSEGKGHFVG